MIKEHVLWAIHFMIGALLSSFKKMGFFLVLLNVLEILYLAY